MTSQTQIVKLTSNMFVRRGLLSPPNNDSARGWLRNDSRAIVGAVLATTEALAGLLDHRALGRHLTAEQLRAVLEGAEEAGRAEKYTEGQFCEKCQRIHGPTWRIVEAPS